MPSLRSLTRIPQWVIYLLGLIPAVYYFALAFTNQLGVDPLAALEHSLGEWALIWLIVGLTITPILRYGRVNLVKFRRPIGLAAFTFIVLHFSVYLILDRQLNWSEIWVDILKRPYITIGTAAFLLLIPLAITSTNKWIKKLGPEKWRRLHLLVYPAAFCGALHYILLVKAWPFKPVAYLAIVCSLILLRLLWRRKAA